MKITLAIAVVIAGTFMVATLPANAELVFKAEWDDGSGDADYNRDVWPGEARALWPWPNGYAANVSVVNQGINGRWAIDATDPNAHLRYYVADQSDAGTYFALFKLNGWALANNAPGYYLGGLNNYVATTGTSIRDQATYVRAFESTGGSPYIQPGGTILPSSEWVLMAYTYDRATGQSQLHLLDAFTGAGYSSAVASGYNIVGFDLLTVGNAGAPNGTVQPGGSIHGWVDGVRLYDTALSMTEIQAVRNEMVYGHEPSVAVEDRPLKGEDWVRSHEWAFLGSMHESSSSGTSTAQFLGCGLKWAQIPGDTGMSKVQHFYSGGISSFVTLPWWNLETADPCVIAQYANEPGVIGFFLGDEPTSAQAPGLRALGDYIRQNYPDKVLVTSAAGTDERRSALELVDPDIYMCQSYPFTPADNYNDIELFLYDMMALRETAQRHQAPYWSWVQGSDMQISGWFPSESQIRMQLFSLMTAGYKGVNYFRYEAWSSPPWNMIVDTSDNPNPHYYHIAGAAPEAKNLAKSLLFLDSEEVWFVPGRVQNAAPDNLPAWGTGQAFDTRILNVAVPGSSIYENGLLGFFTDEYGEVYFMVTNANQRSNLSAANTSLSFTLTFDNSINGLKRLNRTTGQEEAVALTNHILNLTLPGGTGDLFKFTNTGKGFVGISEPACTVHPASDANGDCKIDLQDFAIMASEWLKCNFADQAACWN